MSFREILDKYASCKNSKDVQIAEEQWLAECQEANRKCREIGQNSIVMNILFMLPAH